MTPSEFKKVGRLLKEAYKELKDQAEREEIDILSNDFLRLQDMVREQVLTKLGFTVEEYGAARQQVLDERKAKIVTETTQAVKEQVVPEAREVVKEIVKETPPKTIIKNFTNVVKEITKPFIVEKTIKEEYDDSALQAKLKEIADKVVGIKIPEIDEEKMKQDIREGIVESLNDTLNEAIDIMGMPDFRKLAMGLQAQIDEVRASGGGGAWGTITGTLSDQTDLQTALDAKVDENAAIVGATKTKITYDTKGLVTAGADATTADIADSTDKRYVTDAQLTVIGNTSGSNTGDQDLSGLVPYSGATGDVDLGTQTLTTTGNLTGNDVEGTTSVNTPLINEVAGSGVTISAPAGFYINNGGQNAALDPTALTGPQTFAFPDASGTFALTSDLPTQYTDEMAQDAVGNAVGNGLDYDDTTGAISVDETELTHNSLGSKQGGTTNEYYHLTSAQATVVGNTSGTNTGDVTLAGTPDYITISGQTITRGQIDLTTDVTGDLPYTNLAQSTIGVLGKAVTGAAGDLAIIAPNNPGQLLQTNVDGDITWGTYAHGSLTGLTTGDSHTQYTLLAGRSGGQTLVGGTAAGDDLTLNSTSNATKGQVDLQTGGGAVTVGGSTLTTAGTAFQVSGSGLSGPLVALGGTTSYGTALEFSPIVTAGSGTPSALTFLGGFNPSAAGLTVIGMASYPYLADSSNAVTAMRPYYLGAAVLSSYTATITRIDNIFLDNPTVDTSGGASVTHVSGLRVADLAAGSSSNRGVWLAVSSGTGKHNLYVSGTADNYFAGKVGIGIATPLSKLHIEGASGWIIQDEQDTNPTTTELDADDSVAIYNKADKFVIAYNNGGTMTYISIPLDGSTTTWTHNTTAP